MVEAASVRTRSSGAGWLTAVAALLLIGAVAIIATSAGSGPDKATRAPAAIVPDTAAVIAPQGLITYEVTGVRRVDAVFPDPLSCCPT